MRVGTERLHKTSLDRAPYDTSHMDMGRDDGSWRMVILNGSGSWEHRPPHLREAAIRAYQQVFDGARDAGKMLDEDYDDGHRNPSIQPGYHKTPQGEKHG